jgi:hypothetical protein
MIKCSAGEYQPYVMQAACLPCPEKFYCDQTDTTIAKVCPQGKYCPANSATPSDCPTGTYNNRTGLKSSSECQSCLPGKVCDTTGIINPTQDCS